MSGEGPGRGVAAFPSLDCLQKSPPCESVPSRGGPLSDAFTTEGAGFKAIAGTHDRINKTPNREG
jgi:hypothetical protein